MIARKFQQSLPFKVLFTYSVGCFVVLQLLDIAVEPLGLPVELVRYVLLGMISLSPLLVIGIGWITARGHPVLAGDQEEAAGEIFRFEHGELDSASRQLRFGDIVDVQPKVFDLIEFLIRERSRVVTKDELFDAVWPGVVVSEASLTQSVKRARNLFRNNGIEADAIRTVQRRGYQFNLPVETATVSGRQGAKTPFAHWLPSVAATVLATGLVALLWRQGPESAEFATPVFAGNSLVVLPFSNLTPDPEFTWFTDGLTETLINTLMSVDGIRVIARGTAFSIGDGGGNDTDYHALGKTLGIAHVVKGSVQRQDNRLRITAKLIRTSDGYQSWTDAYDRELDDIFDVQDAITESIVASMEVLLAQELIAPAADNDLRVPDAYRLYLRGRHLQAQRTADSLKQAQEFYRQALRAQPRYPEALLGAATTISQRATLGELPRERSFADAIALIEQALSVNADFAPAYVQLGEIQHRHFWNFSDASESYRKALKLNPGSAEAHPAYGRYLSKIGEFDSAVEEARIARDLDPNDANAASTLAVRLIRAHRLADARTVLDNMHERFPDNGDLPWLETNWHVINKSYQEALAWIAREEFDYLRLSMSAIVLFHLGRTEQATVALDELIATDANGAAFQIAEVYAQWKQPNEAFSWLEKAFQQGDPGIVELRSSMHLGSLQEDPRFRELVERVGLPQSSAEQANAAFAMPLRERVAISVRNRTGRHYCPPAA